MSDRCRTRGRRTRTIRNPDVLEAAAPAGGSQRDRLRKEESAPWVVCVASAVLDSENVPVAAISASGWAGKVDVRRVAPAVRTAALSVSRVLAVAILSRKLIQWIGAQIVGVRGLRSASTDRGARAHPGGHMHVRFVTHAGVELCDAAELPALLARTDGLVWVDVPVWDEQADQTLGTIFGFHPLAIRDSANRNQVPKIHRYDDHLFLVLHAPQPGAGGHVHYVELDQFIGDRYLVTVHGPLNPAVDPAAAMVEVDIVLARLASGKLKPDKAFELSYALLTALTGRLRTYAAELTKDVWKLEQRVTGDHLGDPESFLDEMFRARHGLLTVSTMSALSREVYSRMATITACGPGHGQSLLLDAVDQFHHLSVMAETQKAYLQGTIEFYQARTNTKMTIAAERLAVIAAVTLPITALSSVLGMNLIVNEETQWIPLAMTLAVMTAMSTTLLVWAKRKGWF